MTCPALCTPVEYHVTPCNPARMHFISLQEQVELLTQENDLLIQQQGAMEEEVVRLHRRLHERGQELALAVAEVSVQG